MIPLYVKEMEIEMTRECNGNCYHCMRGESQNIKPSIDMLKSLFENENHKVVFIYHLLLTGGEVFLNKEGIIYLLNYLIENKIHLVNISIVSNSTIYDKEIIELLNILYQNGTMVKLSYFKDQFHPELNADIFKKFNHLPYYVYDEMSLRQKDIIRLGRAQENKIGSLTYTRSILKKFAKVKGNIVVDSMGLDWLVLESLYLTAKGRFGSSPTDASWQMIDSKYYLDIMKDNLFQDSTYTSNFYQSLANYSKLSYLPDTLKEDCAKAMQNGNFHNFIKSLNDEVLSNYFKSEIPYQKVLK